MKPKKTRNIKHNKHSKIVDDYDKQKEQHLVRLANKMLKGDDFNEKLKSKPMKGGFLDLF
tara:strand:+ start:321 stop:500 length:180 start_codon:yes stop_codon:yes gene_type:complete